MTTNSTTTEAAIDVTGMDCASCVSHVEKAVRTCEGVKDVRVNLARGRAVVQFDPGVVSVQQIAKSISESGYPSVAQDVTDLASSERQRLKRQADHANGWKRRAIAGVLLWLPVESTHWFFSIRGIHAHWMDEVALITATMAIAYVGWGFYRNAWAALRRGTTDMDVLIAMGTTVAYVYSLIAYSGAKLGWWNHVPQLYFMEAAGLLALISLGHYLESRARRSAGRAIHELLSLTPTTASRFIGRTNETESVAVSALLVNDRILIKPGERVPIDGVVFEGRSSVDESMITGESLPVIRTKGDTVIGGTVNHDGRLSVKVTRVGTETALSQIVQLVETAQNSKPPVQKLADRISAVFVPVVLLIALVTAIGWYGYGTQQGWDQAVIWGKLANAVCSVLIIACPCALGLAVPAALMVGTGMGAGRGILIRDIDALQQAEQIDTVVLDKTGTLTQGRPVVTRVIPSGSIPENELLRLAAGAEQFSDHPLAKAVVLQAKERTLDIPMPAEFQNHPGYGITATIDAKKLLVGNRDFLAQHGCIQPAVDENEVASELLVAQIEPDASVHVLGRILLEDPIRPDAAAVVAGLRELGLNTVMLTGDRASVAKTIAAKVGIHDYHSQVKPGEKAASIVEIQSQDAGPRVAMVGDGINDAPALAQADLGIAIGSGSDIAKETGDIVLIGANLSGIASAILLSRATMKCIRQNLFFAFIYNIVAIPFAAFGVLSPLIAAGAMALSDVTVIGNALRLHRAQIDFPVKENESEKSSI